MIGYKKKQTENSLAHVTEYTWFARDCLCWIGGKKFFAHFIGRACFG